MGSSVPLPSMLLCLLWTRLPYLLIQCAPLYLNIAEHTLYLAKYQNRCSMPNSHLTPRYAIRGEPSRLAGTSARVA
ncbi:hypothetical protein F4801DRAFT_481480 [Xylaria longipes]|nr:hypothetical protein F4801DRAFT_481480 [Xylaria longipes]